MLRIILITTLLFGCRVDPANFDRLDGFEQLGSQEQSLPNSAEQTSGKDTDCDCDKPKYAYMGFELEGYEDSSKRMHVNIRFKKAELELYAINEAVVCITKTTNIPNGDKLLHRKTTLVFGEYGLGLSSRSLKHYHHGRSGWEASIKGLMPKGYATNSKVKADGFLSIRFFPPPKGAWLVSYSYDTPIPSYDNSNHYRYELYEREDPNGNPPKINRGEKLEYKRNPDCFPDG